MTRVATADSASLCVSNQPLSPEELRKMNAYWRAANYLSVGNFYDSRSNCRFCQSLRL